MTAILLDLDQKYSPCRWAAWCDRAAFVLDSLGLEVVHEMISVRETDRGFHVRLPLYYNLQSHHLVTVQALMGSDWIRETYNLQRVRAGEKDWNVLFTESRRPGGPTNIEVPAPVKEQMLQDALRSRQEEKETEKLVEKIRPKLDLGKTPAPVCECGHELIDHPFPQGGECHVVNCPCPKFRQVRPVPEEKRPQPRSRRGPTTVQRIDSPKRSPQPSKDVWGGVRPAGRTGPSTSKRGPTKETP